MLWLADKVSKLHEKRKRQNKCERCGLFYLKTEDKCPHCSELKDLQVERALAKRAGFRLGLGKAMFIVAVIITILMFMA